MGTRAESLSTPRKRHKLLQLEHGREQQHHADKAADDMDHDWIFPVEEKTLDIVIIPLSVRRSVHVEQLVLGGKDSAGGPGATLSGVPDRTLQLCTALSTALMPTQEFTNTESTLSFAHRVRRILRGIAPHHTWDAETSGRFPENSAC